MLTVVAGTICMIRPAVMYMSWMPVIKTFGLLFISRFAQNLAKGREL